MHTAQIYGLNRWIDVVVKIKEDEESGQKTWYTKLEFSKEAKESNREQLEKLLDQITKE